MRRPALACSTLGISLEPFDLGVVERDVPTYQYRCEKCGKSFERIETITEDKRAKAKCPKCDSKKVTQVPVSFMS
jgi:putative FmdB family regulatory protein